MTKRHLPLICFTLAILTPTAAYADAGLPMLVLLWPALWIAFIPIVVLEAWVATKQVGIGWKPALLRSGIANAASTVVGIPLTWGALLIAELVLTNGGQAYGLDTFWKKLFAAVIQAPWLIPYEEDLYWLVPSATMVLLVPFFFVSVFIERWTFDRKREVDKGDVRSWSWKANILTYGIMLCLIICYLINNILTHKPGARVTF